MVDPNLLVIDGLVQESAYTDPDAPVGQVPPPTCDYVSVSQRQTVDFSGTGRATVFVYMLPSDVVDNRWDLPRSCSDGTFRDSVIHNVYRVISGWSGNALVEYGLTNQRWKTKSKTFTNLYVSTKTKTITGAVFIRTSADEATWNCRSTDDKMDSIKTVLKNKGLDTPTFNYQVFLIAKQGQNSCPNEKNGAAGQGTFNSADLSLDAQGRPRAVGYVLRMGWNAQADTYHNIAFACSNKWGPTAVVHEIGHVLGAVPPAKDGSSNDGGPDYLHMPAANTGDAMHASSTKTLTNKASASGAGDPVWQNYDQSGDFYRTEAVTNRPNYWEGGYTDPDAQYRYC